MPWSDLKVLRTPPLSPSMPMSQSAATAPRKRLWNKTWPSGNNLGDSPPPPSTPPQPAEIDDELELLFREPPQPPALKPLAQPTPSQALLDCLQISQAGSTRDTVKRMRLMYRPHLPSTASLASAAAAAAAATAAIQVDTAQSVLLSLNSLMQSTKRLSSETRLLSLHATQLVNDVLANRARSRSI